MAQPAPAQQPAIHMQHHVPSTAGAGGSSQTFSQEDLAALSQPQAGSRNISNAVCSYLPSWSHPLWQRGLSFVVDPRGAQYFALAKNPVST